MLKDDHFLIIENLSKSFGEVQAVQNISINIRKGELVSFIGPSGCGKTTLLRMIGGFYEQDEGTIILDGEKIDHLPPDKRPTGMVFQNYALFPHMTVAENIEYGLRIQKLSKAEREKKTKRALEQVRLVGYENRKPNELSGGQQQRVAIARCIVLEPKVLLLDEPLSNLDANLRMMMREEIRQLKEALDLTIIFVTHDQEEALSISDRIVVMREGKIQQIDQPERIYNEPANEFVANFVGHANMLAGEIKKEGKLSYFNYAGISFPLSHPSKLNGSNLYAMIRPEQIQVDPKSSHQGTITRVVYHGSFIRYYVRVNDEEIMIDSVNGDTHPMYKEGDVIGVRFPETPHYIEM